MIKKEEKLRTETRFTKNGKKYGTYIFACKDCKNEISCNTNNLEKHSGFCRKCFDKNIKTKIYKLESRICKTCKTEQNIENFTSKNSKYSKKECQKCHNLRKYNINYKEYLEFLNKQNGLCAICKRKELIMNVSNKISDLAVDHCHKTGNIRGLLCNRCNISLGGFDDNIEYLKNAIKYLE